MKANASSFAPWVSLFLTLSVAGCAASANPSDSSGAGGSVSSSTDGGKGGATSSAGAGGASPSGSAGTGGGSATGGTTSTPDAAAAMSDDGLCGNVTLASSKTIAAGKTFTICAGSTMTLSGSDTAFTIQGTVSIEGTAAKPVKLVSAKGGTMDWAGLIVESGGKLSSTYLEVRNAAVGLTAKAGSSFTLDHLVVESSDALMTLSSNGSIAHAALHALGAAQSATPLAIANASPHFTNVVVDKAQYDGIDMIVVDGDNAGPVFDHVEVADAHCAFHFNAGRGITITNSYVHHSSYGMMVNGALAGHVVHNNFEDDMVNIGSCSGGSLEARDNYFAGVAFDDTCAQLSVTGTAPPKAYTTDVGPAL